MTGIIVTNAGDTRSNEIAKKISELLQEDPTIQLRLKEAGVQSLKIGANGETIIPYEDAKQTSQIQGLAPLKTLSDNGVWKALADQLGMRQDRCPDASNARTAFPCLKQNQGQGK